MCIFVTLILDLILSSLLVILFIFAGSLALGLIGAFMLINLRESVLFIQQLFIRF